MMKCPHCGNEIQSMTPEDQLSKAKAGLLKSLVDGQTGDNPFFDADEQDKYLDMVKRVNEAKDINDLAEVCVDLAWDFESFVMAMEENVGKVPDGFDYGLARRFDT